MSDSPKGITAYWTPQLQEWILSVSCIAMITGMLFSRALLSFSMFILFLNTFQPDKLKQTWVMLKQSRFATCCILFFLTYIVSGLWSADTVNWAMLIKIKLPFIFLPFALLNTPFGDERFRRITTGGILMVLLMGMLYSLAPLIVDSHYLDDNLHLPSPMEGDYIRFTMALVFGIQFVFWFFLIKKKSPTSRLISVLLVLWALLATAYIHIQAAKSGLLCFYLLLVVFALSLFKGKKIWIAVAGLLLIAAIGATVVLVVPSLKKQVDMVTREQEIWESKDAAKFGATSTFVPRLLSYKIAASLIAQYPVLGVGAGDVKLEMDKVYHRDYPRIPVEARLLPHNQFICTALAVGIPLSLVLVAMLVAPMFDRRRNIFTVSTFLVSLLGMMIEPALETQYAVFVYLFFTLFWLELPFDKEKGRVAI
ncbi:O-antigen ligase family protein [Taibaiella koreensis]|uniref:O-antigen ligase family protein n=1 Tax=Taibaiella koreensis TaxID=1268548 RepID=UPI000E59C99A|nr:O-antigen ligase family protein [Taibaiella koreensis]